MADRLDGRLVAGRGTSVTLRELFCLVLDYAAGRSSTDDKPVADSIAGSFIDDFQSAVTAYRYGHPARASKACLPAVRAISDTGNNR